MHVSKIKTVIAITLLTTGLTVADATRVDDLEGGAALRLAELALNCVHREYPNKIAHVLQSDEDVLPPRTLTPAFYGCFDWHSAVHGHWLLARLARRSSGSVLATAANAALDISLTPENIAGEVRYLQGEGRSSFERPYGLAWLLQLAAELKEWEAPQARKWSQTLAPLEDTVAAMIREWLPKLSYPIREGEHHQTAFALGLVLDWARISDDPEMTALVVERTRALYFEDRDCPLSYEPSGHDFLSPCLAEADVMRRILTAPDYAAWLGAFLPGLPLDGSSDWLTIAVVTDHSDGKLAHLDGLNLSRAWMLEGIASGLPAGDPRQATLVAAARAHREAGLAAVTGEHYAGGHWLGTYAMYLSSRRGLSDLR